MQLKYKYSIIAVVVALYFLFRPSPDTYNAICLGLILLFGVPHGAADYRNINSLGIIVFKADQCRSNNNNVDRDETDETSSDDSNDLDEISRSIRDSFSSYDSSVFPENNTKSNLGVALGSIVPKTEKQKSDYTALGIALACMLVLLALLMGLTVLLWSGKDRQAAKIIDVKEEKK